MKADLLLFLVVLVPSAVVAFDSASVLNILAAAANAFFLVAPVTFAVGSLIGLLSRHRA